LSLFKRISTPYLLYESLRNYFSINSSGQLSILYRYCLSILYPIEKTTSNDIDFSTFDAWRIKEKIIAGCKWQKAQLTNVLNYLYPSSVTPIYIDETVIDTVYVPTIDFGYSSANPASDYTSFVPEINIDSTVFVPSIDTQNLYIGFVIFHIPSDQMANQLDIENTINQISIGVNYKLLAI
jgi:hypothetical protein